MKRYIISLVALLLVILVTFVYRQYKWDNLIEKIQISYKSEVVQEIEDYSLIVSKSNSRKFPIKVPNKAIVVKNNLFRTSNHIQETDLKEIILLLNDSANYKWGEIGTPYFDIDIFYFDENNKAIGVTKFSYDGQTYSYPHIPVMKWGLLQSDAFHKLSKILSKY